MNSPDSTPIANDPRQQFDRLLVELLADLAHHRVAQRLAPTVDPQHPLDVVAAFGHVVLDDAFELAECGRGVLDLAFHLGDVLVRVVGERLGEELLLGVEVIVDETARHLESLGDIGDASAGEASLDHHLARGLEDLVAPFGNRWLLHCCERYRCQAVEGIEDPTESGRVISDRQLLEDSEALLGRAVRADVRRVAHRLHVDVLAAARRRDRAVRSARRPRPTRPSTSRDRTRDGRSRGHSSGTRNAAPSVTVCSWSCQSTRSYSKRCAHRVPGRHSTR